MFTGLIEALGDVADLTPRPEGFRLTVTTALAPGLNPGDSLAVNGVCLTVVSRANDAVQADIGPETARITTLGALRRGCAVNLERSMRRRIFRNRRTRWPSVDAVQKTSCVKVPSGVGTPPRPVSSPRSAPVSG